MHHPWLSSYFSVARLTFTGVSDPVTDVFFLLNHCIIHHVLHAGHYTNATSFFPDKALKQQQISESLCLLYIVYITVVITLGIYSYSYIIYFIK